MQTHRDTTICNACSNTHINIHMQPQRFYSLNLTDLILFDCPSLVTSFPFSPFLSFKDFDLGRFLRPGGDEEGLVIVTGVAS